MITTEQVLQNTSWECAELLREAVFNTLLNTVNVRIGARVRTDADETEGELDTSLGSDVVFGRSNFQMFCICLSQEVDPAVKFREPSYTPHAKSVPQYFFVSNIMMGRDIGR